MSERRDVLRNEIYKWSRNLIKRGLTFEGIFLLLATWNFAYFRYQMIDFDLETFKKTIANCDFAYFEGKSLEAIDLEDEPTVQKIKAIYSALSDLKGIRYVGATKVMHLFSPSLFMMWDTKIIEDYQRSYPEVNTTPQGYLNFMRVIQKKYRQGDFHNLNIDEFGVPFAIDSYNYDKSRY